MKTRFPANRRPQRRRRGIFVETRIQNNQAPSGATYPVHPPGDAAPTELEFSLHRELQICRTYGAVRESQRDSVLQPRVGELASLPWVTRCCSSQPQRGCVLGRTSNCHNRVAVEIHFDSFPRVVAALQPWAKLHYPVGVNQLVYEL